MEEIIDATEAAHGYLVSPLSDNISETEEGYLVIVGCPIARTGWQEYSVRDLPQEAAEAMGIDVSNPSASIDLYRPASEVFAPEFLASLNGKPITDNHPPDFVNAQNFNQYAKGHIQNPRRGPEQLEDGEWPLIADLVVSGEPLVSKVRERVQRDISLGYDYGIRREGKKIIQCDMLGNHAAIVPKGRAGDLVSIQDAAPNPEESPPIEITVPAPPAVERAAIALNPTAVQPNKEKKPVSNILKHLLGLGLKTYAVDAEPEALATAVEAINQKPPAERARAADSDEEEEVVAEDRKAKDRKAKDRKRGKDDLGDPADEDVEPAPVDDKRKKMHDALDLMMDKRGKDSDIGELKNLLDEFLSEEEAEPEHAAEDGPADVSELEQIVGGESEDGVEEELCPECGEAEDACECEGAEDSEGEPGEEVVESGEEELEPSVDRHPAHDRARAADAALTTLKILRPFVARSNDNAMKSTFNAMLGAATRSSRASTGDYGKFAGAARAREHAPARSRANDSDGIANRNAKLQAAYDNARLNGGK